MLIISFNITLWHYVREMVARAPFGFDWHNFTFIHFHGFCKDQLNELGRDWPSSESYADPEKFFREGVPQAVEHAVNDNPEAAKKLPQYDAILIDEGQDYYYEWYSFLTRRFLAARDELLVVCDKKQNIYEREMDWFDKRVTRRGLKKFQVGYIDLEVSFRLPRPVAVLTNEFSVLFNLNQDLRAVKPLDLPALIHSQHIVWLNIEPDQWLEYIHYAYKRLKKAEYHPSDMVFLLPDHEIGMEAVDSFNRLKIGVNHVFEREEERRRHTNKKAFWSGDARLKMCTIHSFKGWELANIVLFIPAQSPFVTQLDSMVYTALTRTRENLIVLNANSRYNAFGDTLPKHWDAQQASV